MAGSFRRVAALAAFVLAATPAFADNYPISGRWGVSTSSASGPVDCAQLRVITFNGNQRTDTGSGVPTYRNRTVRPKGTTEFSVVDVFTTGQISNAHTSYTLKLIDADRVDMNQQRGGLVKLRKCK